MYLKIIKISIYYLLNRFLRELYKMIHIVMYLFCNYHAFFWAFARCRTEERIMMN